MVLALVLGLLQLRPATAEAGVPDICPAAGGPTDRFADDDGTTHEANINCASAYQLLGGTTPRTYNPSGNLTRGQAATILVNYVERSSGARLTIDAADDFIDTAGTTHGANIEKAGDTGMLSGFADGTFRPDALISRAQFATLAVRATEQVLGRTLVAGATNEFDDDNGSVHEPSIEKAVDNRMLSGVGARTFGPGTNVTRGQAASIVIGAVGNVLDPAKRFVAKFTAEVEWSNDRTWVQITTSHDLLWSRSWQCVDGIVREQESRRHDDVSLRSVRYTGGELLVVDFAFKDSPPVQADGSQLAWYSNMIAPGNTIGNGPYTAGETC